MFWLVDIIQWTAEPVGPGQEVQAGFRGRHRYRQIHAYSMAEALALAAERLDRERAAERVEEAS